MKINNGSIFVKDFQQHKYMGMCWPGLSVFVDFMNKEGRKFWGDMYSYDFFKGTDDNFHVWLDMNEPSVFDGPEGTLPKNVIHVLDDGLTGVYGKDVKNIYGIQMMKATYEGLLRRE